MSLQPLRTTSRPTPLRRRTTSRTTTIEASGLSLACACLPAPVQRLGGLPTLCYTPPHVPACTPAAASCACSGPLPDPGVRLAASRRPTCSATRQQPCSSVRRAHSVRRRCCRWLLPGPCFATCCSDYAPCFAPAPHRHPPLLLPSHSLLSGCPLLLPFLRSHRRRRAPSLYAASALWPPNRRTLCGSTPLWHGHLRRERADQAGAGVARMAGSSLGLAAGCGCWAALLGGDGGLQQEHSWQQQEYFTVVR